MVPTEIGGYPLPMVLLLEICSLCEEQIFSVFTVGKTFNIENGLKNVFAPTIFSYKVYFDITQVLAD